MGCVRKQVDRDGPFQHKRFAQRFTVWTLAEVDEIVHSRAVSLARNVDEVADTFVVPQQTNDALVCKIEIKSTHLTHLKKNSFRLLKCYFRFTDSAAGRIDDDGDIRRDIQLLHDGLEEFFRPASNEFRIVDLIVGRVETGVLDS